MKKQIRPRILIALLGATAVAGADRLLIIQGDNRRPVIAVWREDSSTLAKDRGPFLITAIWPDGRAIWSKDSILGGPPYYRARISPAAIETALRELDAANVFSAPYARRDNFGPDSSFTVIYLSHGGKTFHSSSWHEIIERNPGLAATSSGVVATDGRTRDEVLAGGAEDYQKYRALWKRVRLKVASLLPAQGEKMSVKFEYEEFDRSAPADPGSHRH